MGYLHYEIELEQRAKNKRGICGDVFYWERTPKETIMLLSDGLGHGIKANIYLKNQLRIFNSNVSGA